MSLQRTCSPLSTIPLLGVPRCLLHLLSPTTISSSHPIPQITPRRPDPSKCVRASSPFFPSWVVFFRFGHAKRRAQATSVLSKRRLQSYRDPHAQLRYPNTHKQANSPQDLNPRTRDWTDLVKEVEGVEEGDLLERNILKRRKIESGSYSFYISAYSYIFCQPSKETGRQTDRQTRLNPSLIHTQGFTQAVILSRLAPFPGYWSLEPPPPVFFLFLSPVCTCRTNILIYPPTSVRDRLFSGTPHALCFLRLSFYPLQSLISRDSCHSNSQKKILDDVLKKPPPQLYTRSLSFQLA